MDIFFAILMMIAFSNAMGHNGKWKPMTGIGDAIAWFMVSLMAIALVRIPIYLSLYGWPPGPYNPSPILQFVTGLIAVAFWWVMTYWRVPGRIFRILIGKR
jgi:mannose/fructose/N-acetylgalactosamine-specific phosphotransferase system component IID